MPYNNQLLQTSLDEITRQSFADAIAMCYHDGITTVAPLGFSGDTIMLYGEQRKSQVSIRNYCHDAELLITNQNGRFLFYGRFSIRLGRDFVIDQYWNIFRLLKDSIESELVGVSNVKISPDCKQTEGFAMVDAYQKSVQTA